MALSATIHFKAANSNQGPRSRHPQLSSVDNVKKNSAPQEKPTTYLNNPKSVPSSTLRPPYIKPPVYNPVWREMKANALLSILALLLSCAIKEPVTPANA